MKLSRTAKNLVGQEMFKVLDRAKEIELSGTKIYHLELGQPRFKPPKQLISSTIESLKSGDIGYSSSSGIELFRSKIASLVNHYYLTNFDSKNVCVSNTNLSISQALSLILNPGDSFVSFSPSFPTYFASASFFNFNMIEVNLSIKNNFNLTIKDIKKALSKNPKLILINSANNPTGAVYDKSSIDFLVSECAKRGIWIVSDETYSFLTYAKKYHSLLEYKLNNIIVISSFSKIFSIPGFRLGYVISNKKIIEKFTLSNSTLISCQPIYNQNGIMHAISDFNEYSDYIKNNNRLIESLSKKIVKLINDSNLLKCAIPQSAFYIFIDISKIGFSDIEFSTILLEEYNVAVTPGRSFGKKYKNYIRISICGNASDVIKGVNIIINASDELNKI
jgi:aspartate/methionine/tyrosine aminotransferase